MSYTTYAIVQIVERIPSIVVGIVGLVLLGLSSRRLPRRSVLLTRTGLIVILAHSVVGLPYFLIIDHAARTFTLDLADFNLLSTIGSTLFNTVWGVGVLLVILGLIAARRPEETAETIPADLLAQPAYPTPAAQY